MRFTKRTCLLFAALALPVLLALTGCGKKEEASAPGYYDGPMKPKGAPDKAGQ